MTVNREREGEKANRERAIRERTRSEEKKKGKGLERVSIPHFRILYKEHPHD